MKCTYLKEANKKICGEFMRNELHKDGKVITCYEKGYMVDNVPVKELEIDQDNGIDKKDRVQRLIEYL